MRIPPPRPVSGRGEPRQKEMGNVKVNAVRLIIDFTQTKLRILDVLDSIHTVCFG